MSALVFDPAGMRRLAASLRTASVALEGLSRDVGQLGASSGGLPPGVGAMVTGECSGVARVLAAGADLYRSAAADTSRAAEAAVAAGEATGQDPSTGHPIKFALGLTKNGLERLGKELNGGTVRRGDGVRKAVRLFADLTGNRSLATLTRLDEYAQTYRDVGRSKSPAVRNRALRAFQAQVAKGLAANPRPIKVGYKDPKGARSLPKAAGQGTGLERLGKVATGLAPVAGTAIDGYTLYTDWERLTKGSQETGAHGTVVDIRNGVAVGASSLHVVSDLLQAGSAGPQIVVTAPAAAVVDGVALVGDVAVLGVDVAPTVVKGVGKAPGAIKDVVGGGLKRIGIG